MGAQNASTTKHDLFTLRQLRIVAAESVSPPHAEGVAVTMGREPAVLLHKPTLPDASRPRQTSCSMACQQLATSLSIQMSGTVTV